MTLILDPNNPAIIEYQNLKELRYRNKLAKAREKRRLAKKKHKQTEAFEHGCQQLKWYNIDHNITPQQIEAFLSHGFTLGMMSNVTGAKIRTLSHRLNTYCKQRTNQRYYRKPKVKKEVANGNQQNENRIPT